MQSLNMLKLRGLVLNDRIKWIYAALNDSKKAKAKKLGWSRICLGNCQQTQPNFSELSKGPNLSLADGFYVEMRIKISRQCSLPMLAPAFSPPLRFLSPSQIQKHKRSFHN